MATFESNIAYTLRFMIDTKVCCLTHPLAATNPPQVVGMNWIEIPAGQYTLLEGKDRKSHCQIELSVRQVDVSDCWGHCLTNTTRWDRFISHAPEGEWSKTAPLRILSFDIECAGRKGIFPEANVDPVIQIANMVTRQGKTLAQLKAVVLPTLTGRRKQAIYSQYLHLEYLRTHCRLSGHLLSGRS